MRVNRILDSFHILHYIFNISGEPDFASNSFLMRLNSVHTTALFSTRSIIRWIIKCTQSMCKSVILTHAVFACRSSFNRCQITIYMLSKWKSRKNCVTLNRTLIKCAHILCEVCLTGQSLWNYRIPIIQLERVIFYFFTQRLQNNAHSIHNAHGEKTKR